ncbi:LysR substrate-binding domain-containing protein [uncultured Roseobacter sp.]|uniref:LysR substrate-binding domain-containing protein n=1 Tax=uncultured Roseobacter sp. TaxID=114847 RepID=UPI002629CAF5|nr:LysR substrate-binding domain-containing protein [uncultured Roseobacter sp.]
MQLNSRILECFHATMTVGTVTGAAELLNTSQPAVSRSLKQLEDATRMVLFVRTGNRVTPTREAQLLYEEVDRSFRGLKRIGRAADEIRNMQSGNIHIACAPAFSQGFLVDTVKSFRENRPGVQTIVTTRQTPTISELATSQQCDLGLAAYAIEPEGTEFETFTDAPEICILPAGHHLCEIDVVTPEDLHGVDFVSLGQIDPYSHRLQRLLGDHDVTTSNVMEVQNSLMAGEAVAEGLGVSIINPFSALSFRHRAIVFRRFSVNLAFSSTLLRSKYRPVSALVDEFRKCLFETRDRYLAELEILLSR